MTIADSIRSASPLHLAGDGRTADCTPATLIEALDHHVAVRGDKVFTRHVVSGTVTELTFAEFAARSEYYAAHLQAMGLAAGDVILIFLPTSPETLPAFFGAMMIGAVPSLMPGPSAKQHPSIYWPSHDALLDRIKPPVMMANRENAGQMMAHGLAGDGRKIIAIEDLGAAPAPARRVAASIDDVALLQHSSGTTSLKKGVALSHGAILRQLVNYSDRLEATDADGIVSWLPIYHDMGLIACSVMPLLLGQTVTILDPFQWVGRPATLFDAIEKYKCQLVWLPNFAFEHLVRAVPRDYAGDLSSMRSFIDCSEPCKLETIDRFVERFAGNGVRRDMIGASYAMAETVFAVSQTMMGRDYHAVVIDLETLQRENRAMDVTPHGKPITFFSNGPPISGVTVTIRDGDRILGENEIGEVVVQGEYLYDGYFNNPELTAERLVDGWYRTRDRAFIRDGEMYILGRNDDLMIISGRNLHANEVELVVSAIPGLKPGRGVAFGIYNDVNASEELVIVAERDDKAPGEDRAIQNKVREVVFDHTGIDVKDIVVVDPGWLVKTTSGKISREMNKLRYIEMQANPEGEAAPAPVATEDSFADVARIIARTFRCPVARISRDTVATDISGWDSLAHSTLILEIEQELGIRFGDDEIFGFDNVGALVDRTGALRASGSGNAGDRIIAEGEAFSILVMGEPSDDAPDLIIFAGAALQFGGQNMMDFASTLRGTPGEKSRRFFVTDRSKHWFTDSLDEIAAALNAASPGPKILLGNSMGGYGALKFGPLLNNVVSILALAPQPYPPRRVAIELDREGKEWYVTPAPDVPTCVVFGEIEDEQGKEWIGQTFTDPAHHTILTLANCGHNVVPYLNSRGLLAQALVGTLDPATMGDVLKRIINSVEPSEAELRRRVYQLDFVKMGPALFYLKQRYPKTGATLADTAPVD